MKKNPLENIVGIGENDSNQHFLLFPQCFLLPISQGISVFKLYLVCRLQMLSDWTSQKFCPLVKSLSRNQHFHLFPQCFLLPISQGISVFKLYSFCRLQMLSIWTSVKFCPLVKSEISNQVSLDKGYIIASSFCFSFGENKIKASNNIVKLDSLSNSFNETNWSWPWQYGSTICLYLKSHTAWIEPIKTLNPFTND